MNCVRHGRSADRAEPQAAPMAYQQKREACRYRYTRRAYLDGMAQQFGSIRPAVVSLEVRRRRRDLKGIGGAPVAAGCNHPERCSSAKDLRMLCQSAILCHGSSTSDDSSSEDGLRDDQKFLNPPVLLTISFGAPIAEIRRLPPATGKDR